MIVVYSLLLLVNWILAVITEREGSLIAPVESIGGFHVTSLPPCWWTKTKDFLLAPFVRPPAIVRWSIVVCVP